MCWKMWVFNFVLLQCRYCLICLYYLSNSCEFYYYYCLMYVYSWNNLINCNSYVSLKKKKKCWNIYLFQGKLFSIIMLNIYTYVLKLIILFNNWFMKKIYFKIYLSIILYNNYSWNSVPTKWNNLTLFFYSKLIKYVCFFLIIVIVIYISTIILFFR